MHQLQRPFSQEQESRQQEFVQQDYKKFRITLADRGWAVLGSNAISHDPVQMLERLGQIVPQYNGRNTFEVTYTEGFDDVPYSQSMNGLGAHTEAPAYDPPPRYLALLCHRQARCGKGQTLLADGIDFFDNSLSKELRDWALINPVDFVAAAKPGSREIGQRRSLIRGSHNNEPMLRFSYNLFRYGNVNPSREDIARTEGNDAEPLSRLAEEGERYFAENHVPVLVPDGCMLVWNNHRLMHGRGQFSDPARHLTRYWLV